jgi:hypothetical protein
MAFRIILVILVMLTGTGLLRAQTTGYSMGDFSNSSLGSGYGKITNVWNDIKGSPFEHDEFHPGEVFTSSRLHYTGVLLRYNIYSDQMEFKKTDGGIFEIDRPETLDSILIGDSKYIYTSYKAGLKIQNGYLKVLTQGIPVLLLRMNVILKAAEPPALYKDAVPPQFERGLDRFLLLFPPNEAIPFSGKKDFLEILPAYHAEMDQFINKNKIKFNRQEDMIRMINYYSFLMKQSDSQDVK